MLPITVATERGERIVRPTADELTALIRRIGGEYDRFLVVQRVPDLPEVFIQTWYERGDGEGYQLEYRTADGQFKTVAGSAEPVIAAMLGWTERERDWIAQHEWTLVELGAKEPAGELDLPEETRKYVLEQLRLGILGGYRTRSELAGDCEDCIDPKHRNRVSRAQLQAVVDAMWLERVHEQESWQGETDPERLTRAFEALDASGVVARENFTCCHSCGQAEIGAEAGPETRGFVYFHYQCTEGAARGSGLTLYYGGFDGSEETTASVGHEVVAALKQSGLPVEWNGDPGKGIEVTPLDWRKRLVG